ncbi:MAG: sensor histidine kinase, partial [Ilumatobacteraceae bacterium]
IGFAESAPTGDGLANLRSRAASLGGDCRCDSVPGVGTVVHWSLSRQVRPDAVDVARPLAS